MAKKLFALEDADVGGEIAEMEVSPEAGEIADVETEIVPDAAETAADASAIDEGISASDQMSQVEDVVSAAADEEGLDPVAAEAIKIAVEAICARVGANPKSVYSLYATENFRSSSSRKANTSIALEGVGEFLKDLWKKIKAAVQGLWAKVKAFWEKHFSSLGRIRKAIDATKARVSETSGKISKPYIEEAPSFLSEAFAGKNDISASLVKKYIQNHADARDIALKFVDVTSTAKVDASTSGTLAKFIKSIEAETEVTYGTKDKPLVGGVYNTIKIEFAVEDSMLDITTDRDTIDDKDKKLGLSVSDKSGLNEILKATHELIKSLEKVRDRFEKTQSEFTKMMVNVEKMLNTIAETGSKLDKAAVKEARGLVKIVYKLQAKAVSIFPEVVSNDVRVVKAAIGYVNLCLKNYK